MAPSLVGLCPQPPSQFSGSHSFPTHSPALREAVLRSGLGPTWESPAAALCERLQQCPWSPSVSLGLLGFMPRSHTGTATCHSQPHSTRWPFFSPAGPAGGLALCPPRHPHQGPSPCRTPVRSLSPVQPCDAGAPGRLRCEEPRTRGPHLASLLDGPATLPSGGSEDRQLWALITRGSRGSPGRIRTSRLQVCKQVYYQAPPGRPLAWVAGAQCLAWLCFKWQSPWHRRCAS